MIAECPFRDFRSECWQGLTNHLIWDTCCRNKTVAGRALICKMSSVGKGWIVTCWCGKKRRLKPNRKNRISAFALHLLHEGGAVHHVLELAFKEACGGA